MTRDVFVHEDFEKKPWHRRDGESGRDYAAFRCYLEIGPSRTVNGALMNYRESMTQSLVGSSVHNTSRLDKSMSYRRFMRLAKLHLWADRAAAWDVYMQDVEDIEEGVARKKVRQRRRKILEQVMDQVETYMDTIRENGGFEKASDMRMVLQAVGTLSEQTRAEYSDNRSNRPEQNKTQITIEIEGAQQIARLKLEDFISRLPVPGAENGVLIEPDDGRVVSDILRLEPVGETESNTSGGQLDEVSDSGG